VFLHGFNVLISKINLKNKKIILILFKLKNTLKNNYYLNIFPYLFSIIINKDEYGLITSI